MFSDIPTIPAVLRNRAPNGSGALMFEDYDVKILLLNDSYKLTAATAAVYESEKSLLILSPTAPLPGSRLRWQNRSEIIRSVKVIRDFSGTVIAFRCTC